MRRSYCSLQKNGTGGVRRRALAGGLGQQVGGRERALLGGVGPVLDAHLLVEQRVVPAHHVAGGVHQRRADVEVGAAHHAVAELEPRALQPAVVGVTPMPTTTTSAGSCQPPSISTAPGWRPSIVTPQRTSTPWSAWTAATAAPIAAPRPRISGAGALSSTSTSLPSLRAVAATSRPMKPAPIDDHATTAAGDPLAQGERVVERAQHDDVGQIVLARQLRGARTGGEDRTFEAHVLVRRRARSGARRGRVRRPRSPSRQSTSSEAMSSGWRSAIRSASHSPREQPLRQRRPVVRHDGVVADHGDRAVEAGGAQRLGGAQPGERGPDDDDVAHHASIRSTSGPYRSHMVPTERHRRRDQ